VVHMSPSREPDLEQWEDRVEVDIREDAKIPETQREAIIQARVGQGGFAPTCRESSARVG